jgi:hypothetical protein
MSEPSDHARRSSPNQNSDSGFVLCSIVAAAPESEQRQRFRALLNRGRNDPNQNSDSGFVISKYNDENPITAITRSTT